MGIDRQVQHHIETVKKVMQTEGFPDVESLLTWSEQQAAMLDGIGKEQLSLIRNYAACLKEVYAMKEQVELQYAQQMEHLSIIERHYLGNLVALDACHEENFKYG